MITRQLEVFFLFDCILRSFNLRSDLLRLLNSWLSYLIHLRLRIRGQRWQATLQWAVFSPCSQQFTSFSAHAPSIFSFQHQPTSSFPFPLISFSSIPPFVWFADDFKAFRVVFPGKWRIYVLYRVLFPILTFLSSSQSLVTQFLVPFSFHGTLQVSRAFLDDQQLSQFPSFCSFLRRFRLVSW